MTTSGSPENEPSPQTPAWVQDAAAAAPPPLDDGQEPPSSRWTRKRIAVTVGLLALLAGLLWLRDWYAPQEEVRSGYADQNAAAVSGATTDGTNRGMVHWRDLRPGDCFVEPEGETIGVDVRDCGDAEASLRINGLVLIEDEAFPPEARQLVMAEAQCPADAVTFFRLTQQEWDAGARALTCVALN